MASVSNPLRLVRRNPTFFALAAGTLGLALALATTMFALLDAVRHPFVPYPEPERAFTIWLHAGASWPHGALTQEFDALRSSRTMDVAAVGFLPYTIVDVAGTARTMRVVRATSNLFRVLGVRPQVGRGLTGVEAGADGTGVIVSDALWHAALDSSRTLRDATISVNGRVYPVIGVAPPGLRFPYETDVWMSVPMTAPGSADFPYALVVGRLRRGVTRAQAEGELEAGARLLTSSVGQQDAPFRYELRDLGYHVLDFGYDRALTAAAAIVLLIACANAGHLVSVRGIARRRELALRAALGASRRALVWDQLAECMAIAAGAGTIGLLGGEWGATLIAAAIPPYLTDGAVLLSPHITWRVYAFVVVAASAVLAIFGVLPALRASRVDPSEPLKSASPSTTGRRGPMGRLVAGQIALALVVLFGAGLMWRAAERVGDYDFGFDARNLLMMPVGLDPNSLPNGTTLDDAFRAITERTTRVAGVRAAAELSLNQPERSQIQGEAGAEATRHIFARYYVDASPNLLRTLGIPVVAGRDFEEGDATSGGVAIVDERAAAVLWPNERVVGRQIQLGSMGSGVPWIPVVGVARNANLVFKRDPYLEPPPLVYVVRANNGSPDRKIVIRAGARIGPVATAVTRAVERTPALRYFSSPSPWLEQYDDIVMGGRFLALLFALYGMTALVLSTLGLYTTLAYSVSQRRREFGVRMALGARPADLRRMVMREAFVTTLAGIAAGALIALWATRILDGMLYGMPHLDALSLIAAEVLLLGIGLLACVAPARRASRAEPLEVLRDS